jgi:formiminotetrahydrofolate cyclodeaminase
VGTRLIVDENSQMTLDEEGDEFVLRQTQTDGSVKAVILTPYDVLALAQSAPKFRQRILSKLHPGDGTDAVFATPVAQIGLHRDALGENILLNLIAHNDQGVVFELPLHLAEETAQRILAHVVGMRAAKPTAQ